MHWPLIGWVLKHGGIFGVKRGKADVAAIKTAMKYLKDGEMLLMFPEGTRHQDGECRRCQDRRGHAGRAYRRAHHPRLSSCGEKVVPLESRRVRRAILS